MKKIKIEKNRRKAEKKPKNLTSTFAISFKIFAF